MEAPVTIQTAGDSLDVFFDQNPIGSIRTRILLGQVCLQLKNYTGTIRLGEFELHSFVRLVFAFHKAFCDHFPQFCVE